MALFLLGGLDQALNPKSKQTIGKRVRLGFTDDEFDRLTKPIDFSSNTGLGIRKKSKGDFTF